MAKKINEQYDEIFKYVGEKCGLSKLTYETYLGLRDTDVRKKKLEEFLEDNLPIEKSSDDEFKKKVNELNENPLLKKEDKFDDVKGLFNLGDILYSSSEKKEETKPITPAPIETKPEELEPDKDIESKTNKKFNIKNIFKKGGKTALTAVAVALNGISLTMLGFSVFSGLLLQQSFGLVLSMASPFLIIPAATVGIALVVTKKDAIKKWWKKLTNKKSKVEKSDLDEKTSEFVTDLDKSLFEVEEDRDDKSFTDEETKSKGSFEEEPPLPTFEKSGEEPPLPVFADPKKETSDSESPLEPDEVSETKSDTTRDLPDDEPIEPSSTEVPTEDSSADDKSDTKPSYSPRRQMVINDLNQAITTSESITDKKVSDVNKSKKELRSIKTRSTKTYNKSLKEVLEETEITKKRLQSILDQTESYVTVYDKAIKETTEYKVAMREREYAIQKIRELEEKEQTLLRQLEEQKEEDKEAIAAKQEEIKKQEEEIVKRRQMADENKALLDRLSTKEEVRRTIESPRNIQVTTNTGEVKTIYTSPYAEKEQSKSR